ncbi:MAG: AAA family ATPase [Thermoleophilia bacterium]|nr:AAA family ATPase [Thermoleophilia bacterium]
MAKQGVGVEGEDSEEVTVVVAGDVVVDHLIYAGTRDRPYAIGRQGTAIRQATGGAKLLFRILQKIGSNPAKPFVPEFGMASTPRSRPVHSYSLLAPFPAGGDRKGSVWRIAGILGYGDSTEQNTTYGAAAARAKPASVVVLDDGALGFRSRTNKQAWPEEIRGGKVATGDWVVLKTSAPVGQGDLWHALCGKEFCDRLVVVVSASDLRQEEVGIAEGLSWERTAQDLMQELTLNKSISDLTRCRHLVVCLGTDGALWVSRLTEKTLKYRLVFDPGGLEGAWAQGIQGQVWGGTSCLVAAIVAELVGSCRPDVKEKSGGGGGEAGRSEVDIGGGIMRGLSAMRQLLLAGHGPVGGTDTKARQGFPYDEVVSDLRKPSSRYRIVEVPAEVATVGKSKDWTIISGERKHGELYGLARRVALFGSRALVDEVPHAVFGKLMVVDRVEIESLRGLERLIRGYEENPRASKPLSIAVFGAPGSGKSFSVKQIAQKVLGQSTPVLDFNLSQFTDPGELIGAFHQVRDKVLLGTTPVVFWDEFDSREYMWLQYLLAPMQDGKFQEGQVTHPIGKCLFVFAGGTSYDFANFAPHDERSSRVAEAGTGGAAPAAGHTGLARSESFRLAKGPDFVSRLSGYLNVAGPNRRQRYDADRLEWVDDDDPSDLCFPVRRALLMRSAAGYVGPAERDVMDIDSGLLSAFLEVRRYEHGARSLETILGLTKSTGLSGLKRSALPPEEQLSLHVDYDEFMNLVDRDRPFKMRSEELAPAVHEFYRELCRRNDWEIQYDMPFVDLPDGVKADNIAAAARIPRVLALAGLAVVSDDGHSPSKGRKDAGADGDEIRQIIEKNLETMAECEHDGWMEQKYRDGWSYGLVRDEEAKRHPCMLDYASLSREEQEKDRHAVQCYPEIVESAGFTIVKAGSRGWAGGGAGETRTGFVSRKRGSCL